MGASSEQPQVRAEIKAGPLEDWLNCISAIVEEYRHRVTEHGFLAKAVDPSNASMIQTTLGANEFETFDCKEFTFGMDTSELLDTLKKANVDDIVTLEIDDNYRLSVSYGPIERSIATIDPDVLRQEPDIPSLDFLGSAIIPTDHYDNAVWTCEMVGDASVIELDPDGSIVFRADGDTDSARTELTPEYLESCEIEGLGESMISIDFQRDIIRALSCDTIELSVGDELPIKIIGTVGENSRAEFHVAPRIASD